MIGNKVVFRTISGKQMTGHVMDKVNVPIASGTNEYTPMDNYMIKDFYGRVHTVNPIFIEKVFNKYPNTLSLTELCKPFLNKPALQLIEKKIQLDSISNNLESTELHPAYLGITVSFLHHMQLKEVNFDMYEDEDIVQIPEHSIKKLCGMINKAVENEWLKEGCLHEPFALKLAQISPAQRYMLMFYGVSDIPFSALKEKDFAFYREGELPKEE